MDENNSNDDVAGAVNDETDAHDDVPGGDTDLDDESGTTSSDPLSVAVEALEGLTDAVEALSGVKDEDGDGKLSAVATGLKAMSERLASVVTDAGGSTEDESKPAPAADGDKESVSSVLATVRDALQDVTKLLGESAARQTIKADGETPKKPKEDKDEDLEETNKGSGSIADAVRALVDAVKGQQKRLIRMEKRFGLPSSLPVGEGISKSDREDNSWPMDLNNPMDRESVDKSVSFHEV